MMHKLGNYQNILIALESSAASHCMKSDGFTPVIW